MLLTIALVLLVPWALGFFAFHVAGGLIHLLLVLAVILAVGHLIQRRRVVCALSTGCHPPRRAQRAGGAGGLPRLWARTGRGRPHRLGCRRACGRLGGVHDAFRARPRGAGPEARPDRRGPHRCVLRRRRRRRALPLFPRRQGGHGGL